MSIILVAAVVMAALNLARMAITGTDDLFGVGIQVFVIVVGGFLLLTADRRRA